MNPAKISRPIMSCIISLMCCILTMKSLAAEEWLVADQQAYEQILSKVKAGDDIVLANGTWHNFEILLKGEGTKQQPITLKAQTKGKVLLTGQSNLRLAGQYLVVSGLVFKDGYTPSSAVIAFRSNKATLAYHSRVTEVVMASIIVLITIT